MLLNFTKMHGLGNDFVVFESVRQSFMLDNILDKLTIRKLADRRLGIGCDQVLLLEPPRTDHTDFYYRIFNADGSEVEQCGNGARCIARFIHDQGLSEKNEITLGTMARPILAMLEPEGNVRVAMGIPELTPANIPFLANSININYDLEVAEKHLTIGAVALGNPHAVLLVEKLDNMLFNKLGPLIESHPRFPNRVNVGFMEIYSSKSIGLRVYERGVGETLACGTGACAAVVYGRLQGLLEVKVQVTQPGGDLIIEWEGPSKQLWMTGPANTVFHGQIVC